MRESVDLRDNLVRVYVNQQYLEQLGLSDSAELGVERTYFFATVMPDETLGPATEATEVLKVDDLGVHACDVSWQGDGIRHVARYVVHSWWLAKERVAPGLPPSAEECGF